MAMNFTTAGIKIEDLLDKKNSILKNIANVIAEACVSRAENGKVSENLITDVNNLIKSLPEEDKVVVLSYVMYTLTSTGKFGGKGNNNSRSSSDSYMNDIFGNRHRS